METKNILDLLLLIVTSLGFIIALKQFGSYREELKVRTFIEFRQRFKSDAIILKILEALNSDNPNRIKEFPKYELYHFLGFYEELEKMYSLKQVSIEDIDYFFGYYFRHFMEITNFSNKSIHWKRAFNLYEQIKKEHSKAK